LFVLPFVSWFPAVVLLGCLLFVLLVVCFAWLPIVCVAWLHGCLLFVVLALIARCLCCLLLMSALLGCLLFVVLGYLLFVLLGFLLFVLLGAAWLLGLATMETMPRA
jgi:hypothetical protein